MYVDYAEYYDADHTVTMDVEPVALIGVYSDPEYIFTYPNGHQVQPIIAFFECRVVGGALTYRHALRHALHVTQCAWHNS